MKDQIILLFSAIGVAALAWGFWHVLGNDAFNAIITVALVVLSVDNIRLRRQLRGNQAQ